MKHYIPELVLRIYSDKKFSDEFYAFVMLVDISGFTSMTQDLMADGKEGVEIISDIVNDIFSDSIKIIYQYKGFVSSFVGDAFIAIFTDDLIGYPLNASLEIKNMFKKKVILTKTKKFCLTAKISLSYGNVKCQIIESKGQNFYFFRGDAISQCYFGESLAKNNYIVANKDFIKKNENKFSVEKIQKDWFILKDLMKTDDIKKNEIKRIKYDSEKLFITDCLQNFNTYGEFREIISVFISFSDSLAFLNNLIELSKEYGAYLNKIEFTDKGCVVLVIFGAPNSQEKLYKRAVDFSLTLKNIDDFDFKVGLSAGVSFCGLIGSDIRCEYTALGNVVNLSARLLNIAKSREILCDQSLVRILSNEYFFTSSGTIAVKGFSDTVHIYLLKEKKHNNLTPSFTGMFIGREKEKIELFECIHPVFKGFFAGLIYVEGIAGIGKSRFIQDFIKSYKKMLLDSFHSEVFLIPDFVLLPCEEVLKKSFNPFESYLKKYFSYEDIDKSIDKLKIFNERYDRLINKLMKKETLASNFLVHELLLKKNYIAIASGINQEHFDVEMLDAKAKYENIVHGIKYFLLAQSLVKPVIYVFEDIHSIDPDSKFVIECLLRVASDFPIAVIAVCRPDDQGNSFELNNNIKSEILTKYVKINKFDRAVMNELINEKLFNDSISSQFVEFICEKSEGNPFYAEQLILYLEEDNIINKNTFNIDNLINIPLGINQIITSRLDRLSIRLKDTIKSASVLGREFALNILRQMLHSVNIIKVEEQFNKQLKDGTQEQIWEDLNEIKYIFKHALIRDTIYGAQLKKNLRDLHRLAGNVIEDLYKNDLSGYYEDLAQHFEKAEDFDKAIHYLKLSADRSRNFYQNCKVLSYYDRMLRIYEVLGKSDEYCHTINKKLEILELTGSWKEGILLLKESENDFNKVLNKKLLVDFLNFYGEFLKVTGNPDDAIEKLDKSKLIAEEIDYRFGLVSCYLYIGLILRDKGNFQEAIEYYQHSMKLCEELDYKSGINKVFGNIATVYYIQGKTLQAMEYFQKLHDYSIEINDKRSIASSSGNLGVMYYIQGDYNKALDYYLKQYEISEIIGDKVGLSKSIANIGLIYHTHGDYEKALDFYLKNVRICEETGEKSGLSKTLCNIGVLYRDLSDYSQAMKYYERFLNICETINDKQGIASAYGNVGNLLSVQGQFAEAMKYFQSQLNLCEEIDFKNGISKSLGSMGRIYFDLGEYQLAMEFLKKECLLNQELNDQKSLSFTYSNLGLVYQKLNSFQVAFEFFDKAINIVRNLELKSSLCRCLYLKANLFFIDNDVISANRINMEALGLLKESSQSEIKTKCIVLQAKIDNDIKKLIILSESKISKSELAEVYYELWKICRISKYRMKAKDLYGELLESKKIKDYSDRYTELNREEGV